MANFNKQQTVTVDFHGAEFTWNEEADSFNDLLFNVYTESENWTITYFDEWLRENFPKEYKILQYLFNKELYEGGFERYVISTMTYGKKVCDDNCGCYLAPDVPLILFCDAKTIAIK